MHKLIYSPLVSRVTISLLYREKTLLNLSLEPPPHSLFATDFNTIRSSFRAAQSDTVVSSSIEIICLLVQQKTRFQIYQSYRSLLSRANVDLRYWFQPDPLSSRVPTLLLDEIVVISSKFFVPKEFQVRKRKRNELCPQKGRRLTFG